MSVGPNITTQLRHCHQDAPRVIGTQSGKHQRHYLPSHDDEEVQSVPRVPKVALLAKNAQGHHLEHHLHGKEDEDEVVKDLQGRGEARSEGQSEVPRQDPEVAATV